MSSPRSSTRRWRTSTPRPGPSPPAPSGSTPEGTTTAFIKADRGGKVFLDATRAGGATVVAAYSPRVRPGLPVSCPCDWDALDEVVPSEITVATPDRFLRGPTWQERLGEARAIPTDLVEEGHTIPVARVAAMHEGKRRKRAASRDDG